jgi:hypothetical protein
VVSAGGCGSTAVGTHTTGSLLQSGIGLTLFKPLC